MASKGFPQDLPEKLKTKPIIEGLINLPPFIINSPWSQNADAEGIKTGTLIVQSAPEAIKLETKRCELQSLVGPSPTIDITYFTNWGGAFEGLMLLVKPTTPAQVQTVIEKAGELNIKVRGGGAYHTWSAFQPDSGQLLMNTCDLKLSDETHPRFKINKDDMTVTLSPGVTMAELINPLLDNNVTFRSCVDIPTTTFGGMMSGGCHGVGIDQTPMSEWMLSMTVINGKGEIQTIPDPRLPQEKKEEILRAARVNLGMFGIILEMTIRIWPMEVVEVENFFNKSMKDVFGSAEKLAAVLEKYWSVQAIWIPFNSLSLIEAVVQPIAPSLVGWEPEEDDLFMRGINPSNEEPTEAPSFTQKVLQVISQGAVALQGEVISKHPGLTPSLLTLAFKSLGAQYPHGYPEIQKLPWAIFIRDGLDIGRAYSTEFQFPMDPKNPQIVIDAVKILEDLTKKYADGEMIKADSKYPFTMFMEARFIAHGTSDIDSASFGTHTACLGVESSFKTQDYLAFFTEVAEAWKALGGIPHWQKQWTFIPNISSYLRERYAEKMKHFLDVRRELDVDPNDMFMNQALTKVFYGR